MHHHTQPFFKKLQYAVHIFVNLVIKWVLGNGTVCWRKSFQWMLTPAAREGVQFLTKFVSYLILQAKCSPMGLNFISPNFKSIIITNSKHDCLHHHACYQDCYTKTDVTRCIESPRAGYFPFRLYWIFFTFPHYSMKQKWQIHCIVEKQKVTYSCAHVQVMSTLCLQFSKREI